MVAAAQPLNIFKCQNLYSTSRKSQRLSHVLVGNEVPSASTSSDQLGFL